MPCLLWGSCSVAPHSSPLHFHFNCLLSSLLSPLLLTSPFPFISHLPSSELLPLFSSPPQLLSSTRCYLSHSLPFSFPPFPPQPWRGGAAAHQYSYPLSLVRRLPGHIPLLLRHLLTLCSSHRRTRPQANPRLPRRRPLPKGQMKQGEPTAATRARSSPQRAAPPHAPGRPPWSWWRTLPRMRGTPQLPPPTHSSLWWGSQVRAPPPPPLLSCSHRTTLPLSSLELSFVRFASSCLPSRSSIYPSSSYPPSPSRQARTHRHTHTHTHTSRCSFCSSFCCLRHRPLSIFATFPYSCVPTHAGSPPAALSMSSRVTTTPARGGTGGKQRGARQRQQREPLGALTPSNSLQPAMTPAAFKKKRPDLVKALFAE